MTSAADKRPYAVIVGLGRTGLSAARYLRAQGWRLAVTDTRTEPPELAALTAQLKSHADQFRADAPALEGRLYG